MGLFDKKTCDFCGAKIGLLGNKKLEDGNMCKDCAAKLSPWFSERRQSTKEEIAGQLAYREENRKAVAAFHPTRSIGKYTRLLIDEDAKKFMVTSSSKLSEANPDVLEFGQVTGCNLDIDENRHELMTKDPEGKSVSYDPPRYEYSYAFSVEAFVNQTNFKRYLMIVRSAGIIDASLVRSQNVLNFGYILYLSLKAREFDANTIESLVRRWIVLSMLTGRYSGSAESAIDYDIKRFTEQDPVQFVKNTEAGELSDAFWNTVLVQRLDTSVASSPYFLVFLMAQVKHNARGFLSKQITVQSLIEQRGDIHHIFPKKYLQKNGVDNRKDYNQIANYVYTQSEINIKIKDDAPCDYMAYMKKQVAGEGSFYGGITDIDDLRLNLAENCVPEEFMEMDIFNYQVFLDMRRRMMAQYIREYYESLV